MERDTAHKRMNEGHVFAEKGEIVIVDLFQLGLWMFMPCSSGGYFSRFWIPLRQRDLVKRDFVTKESNQRNSAKKMADPEKRSLILIMPTLPPSPSLSKGGGARGRVLLTIQHARQFQ